MRRIDYWVEVNGHETTGKMVYNIRSALALGKKMAKKYGKEVFIQKFRDEIPADFDFPSSWVIEPNGTVSQH